MLVTKLVKDNKLGVQLKLVIESSKGKLAEALATFISADNVRAQITMGELGQYKEVREEVLPKFIKEFTEAMAMKEEEVLTLRFEERGTENMFVLLVVFALH